MARTSIGPRVFLRETILDIQTHLKSDMVKENIGFKVSFFTNLLWVIGRLKLEGVIEIEEMNESIHMALEFFNQALYT